MSGGWSNSGVWSRDYETRPEHHEGMVYIAAIHTLTRRLARDNGPAN